jgi:Ribonuclease G/E
MTKIFIDGLYKDSLRIATLKDSTLEDFEFETNEKEKEAEGYCRYGMFLF